MSTIAISDAGFVVAQLATTSAVAAYLLLRRWRILRRYGDVAVAYRHGRPRTNRIVKLIDRLMAPGTLQAAMALVYPMIVITILKMPPSTLFGWAMVLCGIATLAFGSAASFDDMRTQLERLRRDAHQFALHAAIRSFGRRQRVLIARMQRGDMDARQHFIDHYQEFPLQAVLAGDSAAAAALIAHQQTMETFDDTSCANE